jgi:transposase, IS5 family
MTSTANLLFSHKEILHSEFLRTDLGRLYLAIPFEELSGKIPGPRHSISGKGCKPWFDVKGGIALQFLKHYLGVSDAMVIRRINTDWSMQLFCGIMLRPGERIKDEDLVGSWRKYLGQYLNVESLQKVFASHWKPYMETTQVGGQDATCYESGIRFPTDSKLLWECCQKVYSILQRERKSLRLRKSRCNFKKKNKIYLQYQKLRKKSRRKEKKLCRILLKFLHHLMDMLTDLCNKYKIVLSNRRNKILHTIENIYTQQHQKAYGRPDEKIKDRIVSLYKPYVRPIVRGKEAKPVEFGAKVNKLEVDGISFIEHLSFDNFNETTRYENGIYLQRKLFGRCTHQSADAIYATNKNRRYAKDQHIQTNFVPKGKENALHVEQARQIRRILNKHRSTVLEGTFGNEKNHYLLQKSRARTRTTEVCWIFFGMMTANASIIAKRMQEYQRLSKAA